MDFVVRKLEPSDSEVYKELRLFAFTESANSFSESLEDERAKDSDYFAACMGNELEHFTLGTFTPADRLVAVATFKRDKRSKARHKSYIHTMYVVPEFRGRRLGSVLLAEIVESAQEMPGLEQIHLWVLNPETSPAKHLYLKAGFVSHGPVVRNDLKIDGTYVDAEYMTLSIPGYSSSF
jgi:ribosomal protein S18 acetylase RimI-like enzyme